MRGSGFLSDFAAHGRKDGTMEEKQTDILGMTSGELRQWVLDAGYPAFRAGQLYAWMYRGADFSEMTDLPSSYRAYLAKNTVYRMPRIQRKLVSAVDGTVKYLFVLHDGQAVESVVMKYKHGNTICVSTQAGCRMGCRFCASNTGGLVRNLYASEILGQVIMAQRDTGERISNIVMMGIGEPLDNYDNVIRFLSLVGSEDGLNIGYRHISLSTCGLADGIEKLAQEGFPITLSISLHAVNDEERSALMPVNRRYNLDVLLSACRRYFEKTGRRISFEYTLIASRNDSDAHAKALAELLHRYFGHKMPFHVNLIPVNEVEGRGFSRSANGTRFAAKLREYGVNATVRRRLGPDINASCGQLRRTAIQD